MLSCYLADSDSFVQGLPLEGYESASDRSAEQQKKLCTYLNSLSSRLVAMYDNEDLGIYVMHGGASRSDNPLEGAILLTSTLSPGKCITEYEILMTVIHDVVLSVISIAFIGVFMVIHMGSFFLGMAALLQILLSFPCVS